MNGFSQTDIFTLALGLTEPWRVSNVEMVPSEKNPDKREVHITVDYQEGSKFPCPECGESCPIYDSKQKVWRHLNFFQYRCYIHARVPCIECEQHKVRLVEVPWARSGSGFTLLWRLISLYVQQALEKQDFSGVDAIGVDEYSHKGQHCITVFLAHPEKDGSKARVLFTVEQFLHTFKAKQGEPDKVGDVTSDMCHGYRNAMGDSVDQIRRREMRSKDRKKIGSLEGTRYLWLKNKQNLTEKQLSTDHLDTVTAYNYRLKLQGFYENCLDYESAVETFEALCMELANSRISEMQKVAQSLTRNAVEILNYFDSRKTNALLEGFNSMISLIKHRARGFKNMKNFMAMIYFVCGELALPKATIM